MTIWCLLNGLIFKDEKDELFLGVLQNLLGEVCNTSKAKASCISVLRPFLAASLSYVSSYPDEQTLLSSRRIVEIGLCSLSDFIWHIFILSSSEGAQSDIH